jgi:hypothetical protein
VGTFVSLLNTIVTLSPFANPAFDPSLEAVIDVIKGMECFPHVPDKVPAVTDADEDSSADFNEAPDFVVVTSVPTFVFAKGAVFTSLIIVKCNTFSVAHTAE